MKLYNTQTKEKEEFTPSEGGRVKMYVCGPTVYNYIHIGNARPIIIFDVLRRYFEYKGYTVTYVQNFTDVEDKIIDKGIQEGKSAMEVSRRYIEEYFQDARALGVRDADVHPRVSEHIPEIIETIEVLVDKGHAYSVDGNVYFRVASFEEYGCLSGQSISELESGARVEVNDEKESALDFALWKKPRKEGEITWPSPWGDGRPGWHIECSAMSRKYLGDVIDIHGGGIDLIFPHHENEIAQSKAAYGSEFVRYWIHNGYVVIAAPGEKEEKMSKSKGNFKLVHDLRDVWDPEVIRLFILSAQYRGPVNFSDEILLSNESGLERLYNTKNSLAYLEQHCQTGPVSGEEEVILLELSKQLSQFESEMEDDVNTANALSVLFDTARLINTYSSETSSAAFLERAKEVYMTMAGVLGLLTRQEELLDRDIETLIQERAAARKEKNYAKSDEIRDLLKDRGIILEDTKDGVKWHRA